MKNSIVESVFTYFCQRVPMLLFILLACWLGIFLLPWVSWNVVVFAVGIVLMVLFQLRLFDDLMQYKNDINKPNRDYTNIEVRKSLWIFLFLHSLLLVALIMWLNPKIGTVYAILLGLNWIAYRALLKYWRWRELLPLFKYPIIYLVLFQNYIELNKIKDNQQLVWYRCCVALLIFFGFLLFERLSDLKLTTNQQKLLARSLGYFVLVFICGILVFVGFQI